MERTEVAGDVSDRRLPDWRALERLLASDDLCAYFMWMFEVVLVGSTVLQVYKHCITRRYLHLTADCRSYWFCDRGTYREVSTAATLAAVFNEWQHQTPTAHERDALADALSRCPS